MTVPLINVVAGPAGSGKTAWIHQQIQDTTVEDENIIYFSPGTSSVFIDKNRIAADFPQIQVFSNTQEVDLLKRISEAKAVYIELGFYLHLSSLSAILNNLPCHAVAVLPLDLQDSEYHAWADEIISGVGTHTDSSKHLWRVATDTQVIDEDSLAEFWYELIHGAYGHVTRAKAIFDVNDGRSIYCDFVADVPQADFLELNLPRHLEGRPQRFSGIEVVGENLHEDALKQTLSDCFLSDSLIKQYQQQVKQMLLEGMEV
ncbi:GTP-binding protein [Rivularia sp. UHCC 0363]|uniref:GTP-binding protein n=1 Tax=Rivularia sp. UHCC 0363 TaxID=3110244 RepID=UPI002B1EB02A|nr:GTP-binding protein [Rivularia sp. UHCC 0363]MEA5596865.1 GTP-binding protein [Rivularia sp. UHCC 0363]